MQIICFFSEAAILLGNITSLKVSGFMILLIKHKIFQVNIRLFEKSQHFWNRDGIWACNPSKKAFLVIFFFVFIFCVHIIFERKFNYHEACHEEISKLHLLYPTPIIKKISFLAESLS